jgi:hypothetical protein
MSGGRRQHGSKGSRYPSHGGPVAAIVTFAMIAGALVYYTVSAASGSAAAHHTTSIHWTTVFQDNFNGKAGSSPGSSWHIYTGSGSGIGRYEASSSVIHVDGHGHLVITTMKTPHGWVSGEIETARAYMPAPGQEMRVESTLELPAGGKGYWPAFWGLAVSALTDPTTEPTAGEDDFAETINNDRWIGQFMHCGTSNRAGPCGVNTLATHRLSVPSGKSGWHEFSWLWCNKGSNSYVEFFIGSTLQMKITERQIGEKYWALAFDHPYVFIYDVAIGGWPGQPNNSTALSASMKVDFIRIQIS